MPTGYFYQGVDIEELFELRAPTDDQSILTGYETAEVDLNELFVPIALGSAIQNDTGIQIAGVDLRAIFAAKGTVVLFPPLPWGNTFDVTATIYRHSNRNAFTTPISLELQVNRNGTVSILSKTPILTSKPDLQDTNYIYQVTDPALWSDQGVNGVEYQVKFEMVSGTQPTLANGHPFDTWIDLSSAPNFAKLTAELIYTHVQSTGLKSLNSTVRISVKKATAPENSKGTAVAVINFGLTVNESPLGAFGTVPWSDVYVTSNNGANLRVPEIQTVLHRAAHRMLYNSDGSFVLQAATWANNDSFTWSPIKSGRWLQAGFNSNNYSIYVDVPDTNVSMNGNFGEWLPMNTTRAIVIEYGIGNNAATGNYQQLRAVQVRFREESTRQANDAAFNIANDHTQIATINSQLNVSIGAIAPEVWDEPHTTSGIKTDVYNSPWNTGAPNTTIGIAFEVKDDGFFNVRKVSTGGVIEETSFWRPADKPTSGYEIRITYSNVVGRMTALGVLSDGQWHSTLGADLTFQALTTADVNDAFGAWTGSLDYTIEVRRKATGETITRTGSVQNSLTRPAVGIELPQDFGWPATILDEWVTNHILTKVPVSTTAKATLRIYANGDVETRYDSGPYITRVGLWYDPTKYDFDQLEFNFVKISGGGVLTGDNMGRVFFLNEWHTFQAFTDYVDVIVSNEYRHDLEPMPAVRITDETSVNLNFTVRIIGASTSEVNIPYTQIARLKVDPPIQIYSNPGLWDNWAQTWTGTATTTLSGGGSGGPVNGLDTVNWGGTYDHKMDQSRVAILGELIFARSGWYGELTADGFLKLQKFSDQTSIGQLVNDRQTEVGSPILIRLVPVGTVPADWEVEVSINGTFGTPEHYLDAFRGFVQLWGTGHKFKTYLDTAFAGDYETPYSWVALNLTVREKNNTTNTKTQIMTMRNAILMRPYVSGLNDGGETDPYTAYGFSGYLYPPPSDTTKGELRAELINHQLVIFITGYYNGNKKVDQPLTQFTYDQGFSSYSNYDGLIDEVLVVETNTTDQHVWNGYGVRTSVSDGSPHNREMFKVFIPAFTAGATASKKYRVNFRINILNRTTGDVIWAKRLQFLVGFEHFVYTGGGGGGGGDYPPTIEN